MAKYVSLTFDDGPNLGDDTTMNDMLDILEKYNIPASFFLIGNKITPENTPVIKRAFDMGCDIQNHSWTHPFMAELNAEQIMDEYNKCDDAIIKITGVRPTLFRPPYINVSDLMYDVIPTPFICAHGVEDWVPTVGAEERYQRMLDAAEDGLMYLLHVMEGNQATLEAVDKLVPVLKEQGYEFVTAPELFKLKGIEKPEGHKLWTKVE